jgi:hypothetical protein
MGEMRIADKVAGDLKVIWDKKKRDEVESARNQFDAMMKKGYLAFSVKKDGEKGKVVKEFDEDAEMLILSPKLQGG